MPQKSEPNKIKVVHLRCASREVSATAALAPKIGLLSLYPKKVGDDIVQSDWKGLRITLKLTIQNRQTQIGLVPSGCALIIKASKNRQETEAKDINHSRNTTFDVIVNLARQMQHCSFPRELSGTTKEVLGTNLNTQCVRCSGDGHHLTTS
ncbi:large ribosomal subunit protein uL11-like [Saccopteryx leptura]|uniref:large ribosomal subunit protein uL11-like n=1 Tax=Saccopteryx leptura TaxID=249018 RepID=UPI00339BAC3F